MCCNLGDRRDLSIAQLRAQASQRWLAMTCADLVACIAGRATAAILSNMSVIWCSLLCAAAATPLLRDLPVPRCRVRRASSSDPRTWLEAALLHLRLSRRSLRTHQPPQPRCYFSCLRMNSGILLPILSTFGSSNAQLLSELGLLSAITSFRTHCVQSCRRMVTMTCMKTWCLLRCHWVQLPPRRIFTLRPAANQARGLHW